MSASLASLTPAFRDPVHGAQRTFRVLLEAMSRPGRIVTLPDSALEGIEPPSSTHAPRIMTTGMAAVLLTLLDAETTVRLAGSMGHPASAAYLRFHTGVRLADVDEHAAFTSVHADEASEIMLSRLDPGTDEAPQAGVTLIIEVDSLGDGGTTQVSLTGPGIETAQMLAVRGLSEKFWAWRMGLRPLLPRGVDVVLVCGKLVAALPRTTLIESIGPAPSRPPGAVVSLSKKPAER